jgi:uncharacterized protein YegP (UPF0339 family)
VAHLEVYRQSGGGIRRWRWRRVAENGKIVANPGQGFTRRWSAKRSAVKNFPDDGQPLVLS